MSETATIWLPNSVVRERARVPATNARDLPPLNFLKPIYVEELPQGGSQYALDERGFQRVMDGYACAECLLEFERKTDTCPLCGHTRDPQADVAPAPPHWLPSPATVTNELEPTG